MRRGTPFRPIEILMAVHFFLKTPLQRSERFFALFRRQFFFVLLIR
jgi:hypothetical protein